MSGEVLQETFALLARKRPRCPTEAAFTAWLHRTVVFTARNHMAKERRRTRLLHRIAQESTVSTMVPDGIPEEALLMLDTAIEELPGADRDLILSRYMRLQSWDELGAAAGRSADAVRKHVERVLEKIAARLRGRGALLPTGALMTFLTDQSTAALSAGQVASVTAFACAAALRLSLRSLLSHTLSTMNTSKAIAGTAIVCGLLSSIPLTILSRRADAAEAAALAAHENMERTKALAAGLTENLPASLARLTSAAEVPGTRSAPQPGGTAEAGNEKSPGDAAARRAAAEFEDLYRRSAALPPEEYGKRLAELLRGNRTADVLLKRAAMIAAVDGDRAAATYLAFKKRSGSTFRLYSPELADVLVMASHRDGAKLMAAIQKVTPDFAEVSNIVHGWALGDPQAAVDWYNGLADDYVRRKDALQGLVVGVAQRDTESARKIYHALSPEDQATSASHMCRTLMSGEGVEAVDRLIEGLSPQTAVLCLEGACDHRCRREAESMVPWLAQHAGASAAVDRAFVENWNRWTSADPPAAEAWRAAATASNPRIAHLLSPQPAN